MKIKFLLRNGFEKINVLKKKKKTVLIKNL